MHLIFPFAIFVSPQLASAMFLWKQVLCWGEALWQGVPEIWLLLRMTFKSGKEISERDDLQKWEMEEQKGTNLP